MLLRSTKKSTEINVAVVHPSWNPTEKAGASNRGQKDKVEYMHEQTITVIACESFPNIGSLKIKQDNRDGCNVKMTFFMRPGGHIQGHCAQQARGGDFFQRLTPAFDSLWVALASKQQLHFVELYASS